MATPTAHTHRCCSTLKTSSVTSSISAMLSSCRSHAHLCSSIPVHLYLFVALCVDAMSVTRFILHVGCSGRCSTHNTQRGIQECIQWSILCVHWWGHTVCDGRPWRENALSDISVVPWVVTSAFYEPGHTVCGKGFQRRGRPPRDMTNNWAPCSLQLLTRWLS